MMKAQCRYSGDQVTLQVCGRLAENQVAELEQCWRTARTNEPRTRFSVDLRGVTFIDPAGQALLGRMYREGARFEASGLHIQEIVNQVVRNDP